MLRTSEPVVSSLKTVEMRPKQGLPRTCLLVSIRGSSSLTIGRFSSKLLALFSRVQPVVRNGGLPRKTETRFRAHLFLCLLAYYVHWHLRQALAPLLF